MANEGKFIDRTPSICAAGKVSGITSKEAMATNRRHYEEDDDSVDGLTHRVNTHVDSLGNNTQIKHVPDPPVKTRFEEQVDIKDTRKGSSVRAHVVDNTFGGIPHKETSAKKTVNPSKPPYEVMWNTEKGHQKYIKTHDDYNPSEDINRKHESPYDSTHRFGAKSGIDSRGIWVRCWCDWHQKEPLVDSNKIQADHLERTRAVVGKAMTPNHVLDMLPKGHTFGMRSDGADLLEDHMRVPCVFQRHFLQWLSSLNKFKLLMEEQGDKKFSVEDFYEKCMFWDKEQTGFLQLKVFYDQCVCKDLTDLKDHLESLLKLLKVIVDHKINYKAFVDILNNHDPPIEIMPFNDVPPESQHFVSPTHTAYCDYLIINNADMATAGLPSFHHDTSRPFDPNEGCRPGIDHIGEEDTTDSSTLCPSIFPHCGPTHRDFFEPRTAETMRDLFEKVGYKFPGDTFDYLWKIGVKKDNNTGFVCVDTFKTLVKTRCSPPKTYG